MEKIDNLIRMTKDEVLRLDGFVMVIVVAIGRVSGGWGDWGRTCWQGHKLFP